jgi:hypothetical protein
MAGRASLSAWGKALRRAFRIHFARPLFGGHENPPNQVVFDILQKVSLRSLEA